MKKQFLFTFARFLAGIVLLAALAGTNRLSAQATGTIVGTVTDASGAAVPGANVQVKNSGTGVTQNGDVRRAGPLSRAGVDHRHL